MKMSAYRPPVYTVHPGPSALCAACFSHLSCSEASQRWVVFITGLMTPTSKLRMMRLRCVKVILKIAQLLSPGASISVLSLTLKLPSHMGLTPLE